MTARATDAEATAVAVVAAALAWIGTPYRAPGALQGRRLRLPRAADRRLARRSTAREPEAAGPYAADWARGRRRETGSLDAAAPPLHRAAARRTR